LPRGRHGLSAGVLARSHRARLVQATAEVTLANGYERATVADIVAHAAVARHVFYEHFTGTQAAFAEAQGFAAQHVLDSCVAVYFPAEDWPEGVWRVLELVLGLIAEHPALAHLQLLACYQAGPRAARRVEARTRSFGVFLQEGYGYGRAAACPPHMCSELTLAAILAIVQRHLARGEAAALPRKLPLLAYVALAPFTGPVEAVRLMQRLYSSS
jgi:AcrR family transcriptional regulator